MDKSFNYVDSANTGPADSCSPCPMTGYAICNRPPAFKACRCASLVGTMSGYSVMDSGKDEYSGRPASER